MESQWSRDWDKNGRTSLCCFAPLYLNTGGNEDSGTHHYLSAVSGKIALWKSQQDISKGKNASPATLCVKSPWIRILWSVSTHQRNLQLVTPASLWWHQNIVVRDVCVLPVALTQSLARTPPLLSWPGTPWSPLKEQTMASSLQAINLCSSEQFSSCCSAKALGSPCSMVSFLG